jgi:hypothetical protein
VALLPQHEKLLDESAISPDVRTERGYRSVERKAELEQLGFALSQRRVPCLLVPIWDVKGNPAFSAIRPDSPRTKTGKTIKYETPRGVCLVLDVPPRARPALADPKVPIFVTEGSRKADAAASQGLCCIDVLGVWGWRGTNASGGKTALADWDEIALSGRTVYIAFDSDVTTKDQVRLALVRFKRFLESRGASVRIVYLPAGPSGTKTGLDDFFAAAHSVTELLALAEDDVRPGAGNGTERPTIIVTTDVRRMVDDAEAAIVASSGGSPGERDAHALYARGRQLVRVFRGSSKLPCIESVSEAHLLEVLATVASWVREAETIKPALPPSHVVRALAARGRWRLRELHGVVTVPMLRPDGTVLDAAGYDEATLLLYLPARPFPKIAAAPTADAARAALAVLRSPYSEFPFVTDADRAAALALTLTLLARPAIGGPVPLFVFRSTVRGSGKTLLVDVACTIATDADAPKLVQARSAEEEGKRLLALGREGTLLALIDNVDEPLGNDTLAAALTARVFKGRILGTNATEEVPVPVLAATGNNLTVASDLDRRVVVCDIDPRMERPEERGFKRPRLLQWVRANRPRLVAAGLTILRAFVVAGRPSQSLPAFGSFEAWSDLVRSALVWVGEPDPCATRARLREGDDLAREGLRVFLITWHRVFGAAEKTAQDAVATSMSNPQLREALAGLDIRFDPARLDARKIAYALRRHRKAPVDGLVLETAETRERGLTKWRVRQVAKGISVAISSAVRASAPAPWVEPEEMEEIGDALPTRSGGPPLEPPAGSFIRAKIGTLAPSPPSPRSPASQPVAVPSDEEIANSASPHDPPDIGA